MPKSRVRKTPIKSSRRGRDQGDRVLVPGGPGWEQKLYRFLLDDRIPADLLPLYAALVVTTHRLTMANAATCVPTSVTLANALTAMGMPAEPMAACADLHELSPSGGIGRLAETVGSAEPIGRDDGTTNGHMVVYATTLRRLIDPTIVQARFLRNRVRQEPLAMMPAVIPLSGDATAILQGRQQVAGMREGYATVYTLQPEHTAALLEMVDQDRIGVLSGPASTMSEAVAQNTHEMVTAALSILKTVADGRGTTAQVAAAHPQLANHLV